MAFGRRLVMAALLLCLPAAADAAAPASNASDTQQAAKTAVAAAMSSSYSAVLTAASYGMTCDGDTTLGADGNTADTDGLKALATATASLSQGVEIMLPTGACEINKEVDIPVSASMHVTGAGIGLTRLEFFTPNGVPTPVGDGLVFTVSNGANLTIDDFTINRRLGANIGTNFIGTAITVAAGMSGQAGQVVVDNLDIYPAFENAPFDSWNTGLLETNIVNPTINNVTISLPGWNNLADPSGYQCINGSGTSLACAVHALPSPANPVATPANLGFGTATGVALRGSGGGNYAMNSVIEALTVDGGLVGLDLAQFQGASVSDSKFASTVYGIRADSSGTASGQLSVTNSLFTSLIAGVYANGPGSMHVTGNYIQPSDTSTTNLPDWAAVWVRNGSNTTISGNDIIGSGNAAAPEYGIWLSADGNDGAPASVTGNTIYSLATPGSVCLGNNANMTGIIATGNSLYSCATYLADQHGGNGYGSNSFQTPDIYDDGHDDVTVPNSLQVGTSSTTGSLAIVNSNQQTFSVDASGNVTANGNVTSRKSITGATLSGSTLATSGTLVFSGNGGHSAAQEIVGNFYFPYKNNPLTITLNAPSGSFPAIQAGLVTIFGELSCDSNNGYYASWHVDGHYLVNNGTPTLSAFNAAIEGDVDSQKLASTMSGNFTVVPSASPSTLGIQVTFGTAVINTWDCTSTLTEMLAN